MPHSTETTSAGSPEPAPQSQPEPEQVNWDYVRVLPDGECVSVDGTHLGHNLPDRSGNRSSARSNASSRLRQSDGRAGRLRLEAPLPLGHGRPDGLLLQGRAAAACAPHCSPGASPRRRPTRWCRCVGPPRPPTYLRVYLLAHPLTLSGYCINLVSVPPHDLSGPLGSARARPLHLSGSALGSAWPV